MDAFDVGCACSGPRKGRLPGKSGPLSVDLRVGGPAGRAPFGGTALLSCHGAASAPGRCGPLGKGPVAEPVPAAWGQPACHREWGLGDTFKSAAATRGFWSASGCLFPKIRPLYPEARQPSSARGSVRLHAVAQQTRQSGQVAVSTRIWTLPNVLSMLRLVGVPIFLWAILTRRDGLALVVLMLSGITDYADGKIARHYGLESRLGQLLDPVADRLYIATTLVGLAWREIIPLWLVIALVSREVLMAVVLLVLKGRGQTGLPVHFVGKAATFNLLYAFPCLLMAARSDWLGTIARPIGWGFAWWGVVLYWVAAVFYLVQAAQFLRSSSTTRASRVKGSHGA